MRPGWRGGARRWTDVGRSADRNRCDRNSGLCVRIGGRFFVRTSVVAQLERAALVDRCVILVAASGTVVRRSPRTTRLRRVRLHSREWPPQRLGTGRPGDLAGESDAPERARQRLPPELPQAC
jgi:hypothetical protein